MNTTFQRRSERVSPIGAVSATGQWLMRRRTGNPGIGPAKRTSFLFGIPDQPVRQTVGIATRKAAKRAPGADGCQETIHFIATFRQHIQPPKRFLS